MQGKTVMISSHILTELSGLCSHIAIMNQGEIVQYGEVGEIERNIIGSNGLRIKVLCDRDTAIDLIAELNDVQVMQVEDDNAFTVNMNGGLEAVARLNKYLVQNGVDIIELHEMTSTLEDVYMEISRYGVQMNQIGIEEG